MKATCTWGDGPDVLLDLDKTRLLLHEQPFDLDKCFHGIVSKGSLDLTSKQARKLALELQTAATMAEELEATAKNYDEMGTYEKENK